MVHTKAVIKERHRQQKQSGFRLVHRKKSDTSELAIQAVEEEEMVRFFVISLQFKFPTFVVIVVTKFWVKLLYLTIFWLI